MVYLCFCVIMSRFIFCYVNHWLDLVSTFRLQYIILISHSASRDIIKSVTIQWPFSTWTWLGTFSVVTDRVTVSAPTIRFFQRLMEHYQIYIIVIIITVAAITITTSFRLHRWRCIWTMCTLCRNGAGWNSTGDEKSLLCSVWAPATFLGVLPHNNETSWRQGSLSCYLHRIQKPVRCAF